MVGEAEAGGQLAEARFVGKADEGVAEVEVERAEEGEGVGLGGADGAGQLLDEAAGVEAELGFDGVGDFLAEVGEVLGVIFWRRLARAG